MNSFFVRATLLLILLAGPTAAEFVARFSELAASAPWRRFVLEINPIKWESQFVTAADALLLIEQV